MKRLLIAAMALLVGFSIMPGGARAEDTKLSIIVFPGISILPVFVAQAKGFYAKRGLA